MSSFEPGFLERLRQYDADQQRQFFDAMQHEGRRRAMCSRVAQAVVVSATVTGTIAGIGAAIDGSPHVWAWLAAVATAVGCIGVANRRRGPHGHGDDLVEVQTVPLASFYSTFPQDWDT